MRAVLPDAFDEKTQIWGFGEKNRENLKLQKIGIFLAQKTSKKVIYYDKNQLFPKKSKIPRNTCFRGLRQIEKTRQLRVEIPRSSVKSLDLATLHEGIMSIA